MEEHSRERTEGRRGNMTRKEEREKKKEKLRKIGRGKVSVREISMT